MVGTVTVTVLVLVLVSDGDGGGATLVDVVTLVVAPVVGEICVVVVDGVVDVELVVVALAAAMTPHATRFPASPVVSVCSSGPVPPYRSVGMLPKLSGFS